MLTIIVGTLTIILMTVIAVLGLIVTIPAFIIDMILLSPIWIPLAIAGLIILIVFLVKRRQILRTLRKGSSFARLKNEGAANKPKEIAKEYAEAILADSEKDTEEVEEEAEEDSED